MNVSQVLEMSNHNHNLRSGIVEVCQSHPLLLQLREYFNSWDPRHASEQDGSITRGAFALAFVPSHSSPPQVSTCGINQAQCETAAQAVKSCELICVACCVIAFRSKQC